MADRGASIFQYDHTVEHPPSNHPSFHFNRVGITHDDALDPRLKHLDTLTFDNGHSDRRDLLLKIDIEGAEWDVLDALGGDTFGQFKQILAEFHAFEFLDRDSFRERARRVFLKLNQTHQVINVHGNNFAGVRLVEGVALCDVYELTYVRRSDYAIEDSCDVFPTALDRPNNETIPELFLGRFQFT